jgi:hypothetical protein
VTLWSKSVDNLKNVELTVESEVAPVLKHRLLGLTL